MAQGFQSCFVVPVSNSNLSCAALSIVVWSCKMFVSSTLNKQSLPKVRLSYTCLQRQIYKWNRLAKNKMYCDINHSQYRHVLFLSYIVNKSWHRLLTDDLWSQTKDRMSSYIHWHTAQQSPFISISSYLGIGFLSFVSIKTDRVVEKVSKYYIHSKKFIIEM